MIRTSRLVLALTLVLALGASAIAYADGASDNVSTVTGESKKKLSKKKFKPVDLFTQVTTLDADNSPTVPAEAAEEVYVDFGKNFKFKLGKADTCSANLLGTTTAQAKSACPGGSNIGSGQARARIPGFPSTNNEVRDLTVTVFNGPGSNQLRLHAYSPTLGAANTQVVNGSIVDSPIAGYGKRLSVPDAPDVAGDTGALVLFNATITKSDKVVTARCKQKKHKWRAQWVYDDSTSDTDTFEQKCKRKKKKK